MWYVEHRKLSVADAHLLANKGKIQRNMDEINRARTVVPGKGGGNGEKTPDAPKMPSISTKALERLQRAGMEFDQKTQAYTGKYVRMRNVNGKWVNERLSNGKWILNRDASFYEEKE